MAKSTTKKSTKHSSTRRASARTSAPTVDYYPNKVALLTSTLAVVLLVLISLITTTF